MGSFTAMADIRTNESAYQAILATRRAAKRRQSLSFGTESHDNARFMTAENSSMTISYRFSVVAVICSLIAAATAADRLKLDPISAEQAKLEQQELAEKKTDQAIVRREQVKLHDIYNADVVAALTWLKEQPFVNPSRIVVSGCSYGGIQTLITAEKGLGVKAFLPFAPGAMSFANVALRDRMQAAVKNCKTPMLLLQANNDYSTGPSELLAPLLKAKGGPSHSTVYPAFGTPTRQGPGAFAGWSLCTQQWGAEGPESID